uniref:FYVE-type domain-containing protein n=2 Tax=Lutzomyia longipalpis TaxID=7200 RepID=A0A1B0CSB9_LUTLO
MDEKVAEVSEDDAAVVEDAKLEMEIKKLREEFNGQRAKMRELYLQKEGECRKHTEKIEALTKELDEAKSQLIVAEYRKENEMQNQELRAQEELASLRQLVQETLDESSSLKDDHKRLYEEYERIRQENFNLKEMLSNQVRKFLFFLELSGTLTVTSFRIVSQQESPSLAPQVKKIARKLGADSRDDTLEDSMRKVIKYAQEDAEVLRSLVVPLEEEIKALKEKLRATDEELQSLRGGSQVDTSSGSLPKDVQPKGDVKTLTDNPCEMCKNYEMQLHRKTFNEKRAKTEQIQKQVERLKEDFAREGALRRELEAQWQEKREQHKNEVASLTEHMKKTEDSFAHLQRHYNEIKDEINQELLKLTHERESVHRHLESLQRDNDILAGKYLATSEEIQNQEINLPDTVEELQEMLLQVHQSLIEARVGCEFEQTKSISLRDESQLLRDQLETFYKERQAYELVANIRSLELQLKGSTAKERHLTTGKVTELQQNLANGEAVQQDFVRLSQTLQVQLERFRVEDQRVRWQDDEDVDQCTNCKGSFTVERLKEDFAREGALRRELEAQWQEKREQHKNEVASLTEHMKKTEDSFAHLQRHYNEIKDEINQELLKLTHERESSHRHLESLQRDNDILAGKYLATSEEIQNQEINLPDTVEELQEMLLQVHQSLIEARVGCEFEQTKSISLRDESQLLRDQLETFYKERQAYEREVVANIRSLELQLKGSTAKERHLTTGKVTELQQNLANGEAVQQDFVRLSQTLQVQLERFRVEDQRVRWQDDEDVDQCTNCKGSFTVTKRKQHCRHCGAIFCDKCLSKSVPSGPHRRPARVCDVCHTLLVQNTAPYFSKALPQTP